MQQLLSKFNTRFSTETVTCPTWNSLSADLINTDYLLLLLILFCMKFKVKRMNQTTADVHRNWIGLMRRPMQSFPISVTWSIYDRRRTSA